MRLYDEYKKITTSYDNGGLDDKDALSDSSDETLIIEANMRHKVNID